MKALLIASALTLVGSCANIRYTQKIENLKESIVFEDPETIIKYSRSITPKELSSHVYTLSSEDFEGREAGKIGFHRASNFLKDFYVDNDIPSPLGFDNYYQRIPKSYFSKSSPSTQNVVAYIEGSEHPEEVIIISAHLDHLGTLTDKTYFGADDNASGTAAVMEMAQAFALAKKDGYGPKRSILFLHLTSEESGLLGSNYYVKHPIYALDNTVANLNIDMIGRVDRIHEEKQQENYIYIIGADRLSTKLHYISEAANNQFSKLILDYKYNAEDDSNRYYYRSDHYNFAHRNIPVIFYFNGEHEDYHQPSDTPDKINYPLLQKRTQLIFSTAWYLANCDERLEVDKIKK
ncbi:M28 family metallopeptidase [Gelidibacter japonicus]|uniref:M28 family metallopeptidase n=1 Tax=Gelidibacter japonicus TaxID=1962232 RepID=UPI00201FC5BB|nr:M28 family metallopeptidase [Gelidibacter japonicus]MCL8007404.1 M28 family metallopeptidase [Gelidibacter japonicus]